MTDSRSQEAGELAAGGASQACDDWRAQLDDANRWMVQRRKELLGR